MKASTEKKIWRWVHIVLGIPIVGYLYGPVASIPTSAIIVRWVIFPLLVLTGFWLWKGQQLKRWLRKRTTSKVNRSDFDLIPRSTGKV